MKNFLIGLLFFLVGIPLAFMGDLLWDLRRFPGNSETKVWACFVILGLTIAALGLLYFWLISPVLARARRRNVSAKPPV